MSKSTDDLLSIMAKLRDPSGGCPWDVEQDFSSIAPYTIEEAYEVADAVARGDMTDLKNELGDLLFQVVFHAQMASEAGHFTYEDVANSVSEKMVRRHPHVFSDSVIESADAQTFAWEDIKARERLSARDKSVLADIPVALPALTRAEKLQKRAARVGFDALTELAFEAHMQAVAERGRSRARREPRVALQSRFSQYRRRRGLASRL